MPPLSPRTAQGSSAQPRASQAERAATWLSLACAVHCLLVPVAVSAMPLVGASGLSLGSGTEAALTLLVVASALAGVTWGYRRHRDTRIVLATAFGLATYLIGHWFEDSWIGLALAVGGALLLAASSFLGARLSHACPDPSCAHT